MGDQGRSRKAFPTTGVGGICGSPVKVTEEIEDHEDPQHPNTGLSWGHNDSNTLYRLHIPNYALWTKTNPS